MLESGLQTFSEDKENNLKMKIALLDKLANAWLIMMNDESSNNLGNKNDG